MFSIGEFSKLCRISARMLRHYDRIGLLHPASTGDENGYRYYEAAQLRTLERIETLKSYGFSLSEIGPLLPLSVEALRPYYARQCGLLRSEISRLRSAVRRMENDMARMEEFTMTATAPIIVLQDPEQRVLGLQRTICVSAEEIHRLFKDLRKEMEALGLRQAGPCQLVYLGEEFCPQNALVEAQIQVAGDAPAVKRIPPRTCAAAVHKGPMEEAHKTYALLCEWLEAHPEYRLCGESIERYLKDESMAGSLDELETGILFPLRQASPEEKQGSVTDNHA